MRNRLFIVLSVGMCSRGVVARYSSVSAQVLVEPARALRYVWSPRVGLRSTIPVRQVGDMCPIGLVGLLSPVIFFRSLKKSAASRAGRDNTAALVIRAKVPHAIHAQASIYT